MTEPIKQCTRCGVTHGRALYRFGGDPEWYLCGWCVDRMRDDWTGVRPGTDRVEEAGQWQT
jgi:hypothetical protein